MRFGVGDGSRAHARGSRPTFDVTRERIRQIESKALRKLRHPVAGEEAQAVPGDDPLAAPGVRSLAFSERRREMGFAAPDKELRKPKT